MMKPKSMSSLRPTSAESMLENLMQGFWVNANTVVSYVDLQLAVELVNRNRNDSFVVYLKLVLMLIPSS